MSNWKQIVLALVVGAGAAAICTYFIPPARGVEFTPQKDRVYCDKGWCVVHESKLVSLTQAAAKTLCDWAAK